LRVSLYHRVAALWAEKFNKHQNAVAALEKILQIDPGDEKARSSLPRRVRAQPLLAGAARA